jgi:signal transduction histidine kinase
VVNLESPVVGGFSESDSHLLQSLAAQAVIAVQEARLLDALLDVAERLLVQPCQEVLDHLVTLTGSLLNGSASAIWSLSGDTLTLRAASAGHTRGDNLKLDGSLTGEAIRTRRSVTSEDVREDPRFGYPELARTQGWTRALIVPLMAGTRGEPVGAFSVYGSESAADQFVASDWDKKVLAILAHYAALAVRNAAAQSALRAAEEQRSAAETFAVMGDVAANLLHRLNNKIGTIPVRVEGIEDKCREALASDTYLEQNLREIANAAREAMATVRASVAHLQSTPLGPVSVKASLEEALASRPLSPRVVLTLDGVDELPPVRASQHGLALVFANLLDNASEAMGGQGAIEIAGRETKEGVELSVTDDGPGIPPDVQERVFELHYSGRTRGMEKLGFGLWWVRTFLSRLGGSIRVRSDGVRKTTFVLRVPCDERAP